MTDSSTSTARGLFVRGARPRWLWLVVPVTLLYLALEFSFSAALLDVIGGTPDDARVRAIEHWGRLLSGFALVLNAFQGWAPQPVIDAVASLSFLTHFGSIAKGVIDIRDLLYFATVIAVWLLATAIVLDMKKAD